MEPVTTFTSGAIVALLAQASLGRLAEMFTETAIAKLDYLRQVIWNKIRDNPDAEKALTSVEKGSKTDLNRLEVYIQDLMSIDETFATELQSIFQEIEAGRLQDNSSMTQNNFGGTNYQVKTGLDNTNYFGGEHYHGKQ
jgi:hypothetical protein